MPMPRYINHAKESGLGRFAYFSEDLTIAVRERIALEDLL